MSIYVGPTSTPKPPAWLTKTLLPANKLPNTTPLPKAVVTTRGDPKTYALQKSLGFTGSQLDGIMGPMTRAAISKRSGTATVLSPSATTHSPMGHSTPAHNMPMPMHNGGGYGSSAPTGRGVGTPQRVQGPVARPVRSNNDYGLPNDVWDNIQKRAANATDVNLTPQEQALRQTGIDSDKRFQFDQGNAQAATDRTVAEQHELYSRLHNSLSGLQGGVAGNYDQQGQKTAGNYQDLLGKISGAYGQAGSQSNAEMERLGLTAAAPVANARIGEDSSFFKNLANSDAAQAQTSIGQSKAMALQNLANNTSQSDIAGTSLSATTLKEALAQTNAAKYDQGNKMSDLLAQVNTLEGTRKGTTYENAQKLKDVWIQAQLASQQQARENEFTSRGLDIKGQLAGARQTSANADVTRAGAAVTSANALAHKTNAELQKMQRETVPGTPEYDLIQSQIAQNTASAAKSTVDARKTAHTYGKGPVGSTSYVDDPQTQNSWGLSNPQQIRDARNAILQAVQTATRTHNINRPDELKAATTEMLKGVQGKWPASITQSFVNALGVAWGAK